MITIDPKEVSTPEFHAYLLGAVTPRPIAFASTVDLKGQINLSPFSFFNCFGASPPLLIFSPARRSRDNTTKHTYENVLEVPEVVINIVNYAMVQQASLASTEYPKGVNEFKKAGFTEVRSLMVKPPRVGEAPVAMECKVLQVVQTGNTGGAGNLVICQVLLMHIQEAVLDDNKSIDPFKLDAVARLGRDWYCRVQGNAIFKVSKPSDKPGIGIDQIPGSIRNSKILTGNDLGMLATIEKIPNSDSDLTLKDNRIEAARQKGAEAVHKLAQEYLMDGKVMEAWKVLVSQQSTDDSPR
jgi:flavin reductase (DIM6/NTAB) family NADH-FMN oxidoreductase RutF